jgi:2-oxo-4-hydroxy-4-carboxy-5-ureidoimidazoline decarboxylase
MTYKNLQSFIAEYGAVYEHSAWVAEQVFNQAISDGLADTPLDAVELTSRFESAFRSAEQQQQLETLRAHPRLACALGEEQALTTDSVAEQSGAGLDQCSADEFAEFGQLNDAYDKKFGFPFIVAVKGLGREQILAQFRRRIQNDAGQEFKTALAQVCQIAKFRIEGIQHD